MRKFLAVLTAVFLLPLPAAAETCGPGLYLFEGSCLTYAEWTAWPTLGPPLQQPIKAADPPVVVPTSPPYRGMGSGNVEQWRSIVAYFWPAAHVGRMLRIMRCESGGNPNALNASTDVRGLFQVRYPFWSKLWPGNYYDPWTNAAIAYQVWLIQGYRAWACKG